MSEPEKSDSCCGGGACGPPPVTRRTFLALTGATGLTLLGAGSASGAAPAPDPAGPDHFVPADKGLSAERVRELSARGERKVFRGDERRTLGMPCGGIAAGQLYVRGDGTLGYWWIANNAHHSSFGGQTRIETELGPYGVCYGTYTPPAPIAQSFALRVRPQNGAAVVRELSDNGFDDIGFIGEYPVATVLYEDKNAEKPLPVTVRSEVFSPFIPLNAPDSALPITLLRFHVKNTSAAPCEVTLAGWLQNLVFQTQRDQMRAQSRNQIVRQNNVSAVVMSAVEVEAPKRPTAPPVTELFDDFENGYANWTVSGEAFGTEPATGTLPGQQNVSGFSGGRLVNTFRNGDAETGRALSKPFTILLPFIRFLIGGGSDREKTALRLLVDNKAVRSAAGRESERLEPGFWDVSEFAGREARLEIVDAATGPWGHVNVDEIAFTDTPPRDPSAVFSTDHAQYGNVALAALDGGAAATTATARVASPDALLRALRRGELFGAAAQTTAQSPLNKPLLGAVASTMTLKPGEERALTFAVSWFFPNRRQREDEANGPGGRVGADGPIVGQRYAARFTSALDVAGYVAKNQARLIGETFRFRDAYYDDTTLPYWLVQRIAMPLANMATEVYQWWKNGRVWCWEGVGCCTGSCGHVYNYAQATARLFPELERSVREYQDFDPAHGFVEATGAIGFRGMPGGYWAGDAQAGYVLKAYREHQCSTDNRFLKTYWPQVKKALGFLVGEDKDDNGLLEGSQHNTYDINFWGPNTMVGSLYLAALRAGARMARLRGDDDFAARCDRRAQRGADESVRRLWNGEYFTQEVDLKQHPRHQYADGCLSDQMLGQWFAHQLDLGYLYPRENVRTALGSVFKYNWAPDVGPQNRAHRPGRVFCAPGEAGLLTCTWPKSKHLGPESVLYRDEVWTGIEYQVAAHLLYEGRAAEALAVVRGIHDRYDGTKHNPWNEVECGDHYARALASWSVLLAATGFIHDGPAGTLGFDPRLASPGAEFRAFFCAAEGWGTFAQTGKANNSERRQSVSVKWGRLRLREFVCPPGTEPADAVLAGRPAEFTTSRSGTRVALVFARELVVHEGQTLTVTLRAAGAPTEPIA